MNSSTEPEFLNVKGYRPDLPKLWGQSAVGEVYPPHPQLGSSNPGKNKLINTKLNRTSTYQLQSRMQYRYQIKVFSR
jgi:hypothetical protein